MDLENYKVNRTYQIKLVLVEKLQDHKAKTGVAANTVVNEALELYFAQNDSPKKVNNTEPKIALLSEKKKEEKVENEPDTSLDMSKLRLSIGADDDHGI